ncbi:MAG: tetratricopeptide repeat protein [Thermodesulfobacteriota bacterium]
MDKQILSVDNRIASLSENLGGYRRELHSTLSTLRDAQNVPGVLTTTSRLSERLLSQLFDAVNCKPKSESMQIQIKQALEKGILPPEMAPYLDTIRVLANKARHDAENVKLQIADAENALNAFLRVLEWFYCEFNRGPCCATIYNIGGQGIVTTRDLVQKMEDRLHAEIERLRQELIRQGQQRLEFKRELVIGLRPADVRETFKDREQELEKLHKLLGDRTVKLIVIVGRGGIGKTALLSKVFQEIERSELKLIDAPGAMGADGIVYVSCRGTDKPNIERLYSDMARMLGSPNSEELLEYWKNANISLDDKMRFLLSKLRDGCYLLVLDNLEDMLSPYNNFEDPDLRTFVELCLTTSHGLRLVATSRELLVTGPSGVRGLRVLPLENGLPEKDAIALLRDLDPIGELGLRNAPEQLLQTVAQQTFGFPRALEIVAGLVQDDPTLDPKELLMDTSLFNNQVMVNLVEEHYRRLSDEGQRVLQALSVFNKPVQMAALHFLLIPFYPTLDVDSVLRTLVRDYFVIYNQRHDNFELHPLDQQYAYSCIPDEGGEYTKQALHKRAADFYEKMRKPASEWKTLEDLQPQLDEFDQRLKSKEYDRSCRLLNTVDKNYLDQWGYYSLLRKLRTSLDGHLTDPYLQQLNLEGLGDAMIRLGDIPNAIRYFGEQLKVAEKEKAKKEISIALRQLAGAYQESGKYKESIDLLDRALRIVREIGVREEEGRCLGSMGAGYEFLGDYKRALELYKEAHSILTETSDKKLLCWIIDISGQIISYLGDKKTALEYFDKALSLAKEAGYKYGEVYPLSNLAIVHLDLGNPDEAIWYCEKGLVVARKVGMLIEQGYFLGILGTAYSRKAVYEKALALCEQSVEIARTSGHPNNIVSSLLQFGHIKQLLGHLDEALRCYEQALALNEPLNNYRSSVKLGIVCSQMGDADSARTYFNRAWELCGDVLEKTPRLYDAIYHLSISMLFAGKKDGAIANYRRAVEVCSAKGVVEDALRDLRLLGQVANPPYGVQDAITLLESNLK